MIAHIEFLSIIKLLNKEKTMLEYFLGSYIVTIAGLIGAYFWGEHVHNGTGLTCVFIAIVL